MSSSTTPPATAHQPQAATVAVPAKNRTPKKVVVPPPKKQKPVKVQVKVESEPRGAAAKITVWGPKGPVEMEVEKTPAVIEVLEGSQLTASFSLDGHQPQTLQASAKTGALLKGTLPRLEPKKPAKKKRWRSKTSWKPKPRTASKPKPVVAKPTTKPGRDEDRPPPKTTPKPTAATAIDDLK